MFNWGSEKGKKILCAVEKLKEKHSYPSIVEILKKNYGVEVKMEALKSAMKRKRYSEVESIDENQKDFEVKSNEYDLNAEDFADDEINEEEEYLEIIEKEKQKATKNKEKRLLQKLLKEKAITELIVQTIKECIVSFPAPEKVKPKKTRETKDYEEALLLFSDAQIGEEIKLEDTNGFGEYNINIFKKRMSYLTDSIREIAEKQYNKIDTLNIFMLGDNVDGLGIYRGQEHHLDVLVVDQVLIGAEEMAKSLIECLDTFDKIKVWGIVGNHGRVGRKGENPTTVNWDYVLYKIMEKMLDNYKERIEWIIPKSNWCIADVCGENFLLLHGDTIKGWNGLH
jgi:hypothetical protein